MIGRVTYLRKNKNKNSSAGTMGRFWGSHYSHINTPRSPGGSDPTKGEGGRLALVSSPLLDLVTSV